MALAALQAVNCPSPPPLHTRTHSTTDERELEWRALNQLLRYPPEIAVAALGEERYREGILVLFKCLQCHRLNKQVSPVN